MEQSEWPIANARSDESRSGRGDRSGAVTCTVEVDSWFETGSCRLEVEPSSTKATVSLLTGRSFSELAWSERSSAERDEWPIANVRTEESRSGRGERPIAVTCVVLVDEDGRPIATACPEY